jgi:glyoxylase-like metal-dependent hydrolase (beta-lactamase superfamily II)
VKVEIIPGIHQLKIPFSYSYFKEDHINIYLIKGDKSWLMVDTGWDSDKAFNALESQLSEIGVEFKNISHIIFTHFHPDHYGLARKLKELTQAKLALHQKESELLDLQYINNERLRTELAQFFHTNGVPEEEIPRLQEISLIGREFVLPVMPEIELKGGERFTFGDFDLEVVWTPGHSPGHICLYERREQILFTGDHILPLTTTNVSLNPLSGENPLGDYLESLKRLSQLEVKLVLPAHEYIFQDLPGRIEEIILHHQQREANIKEALSTGEQTAYQVVVKIPWLEDVGEPKFWADLSSLDQRLALMETLSHLRFSETKGEVSKASQDGVNFYRLYEING